MSEQVGSVTRKKSSDSHGGIRFQSRFTIRWELEDKNFLKIDIICLNDILKYQIMAIKTNENFIPFSIQKASRNGPGNRFWIDTRNTRLLSVKVKCPDPGVASHDQKPDSGDSLRHQIPTPCPHPPPPHGIYIDRCIIWKRIITVIDTTFAVWKESLKKNSGLYGIRTLDLCNTSAGLFQLS